ncbi:MAG: endonuclease domain-containing protein, partial [Actinomycetota bacterium]|nr:endonuclease domain-containing protein [Actinomycetota bacterium]
VSAGAPRPQVNPLVEGHLVDCYWPQYNQMIELDGCSYHADPATQIKDKRRDVEFALKGINVSRFGWPEFRDDPSDVVGRALALLRLRGWRGVE